MARAIIEARVVPWEMATDRWGSPSAIPTTRRWPIRSEDAERELLDLAAARSEPRSVADASPTCWSLIRPACASRGAPMPAAGCFGLQCTS
jgi:hypothetical protein